MASSADGVGFWSLVREDFVHNGRDWTSPGFRALAVYRFGRLARRQRGLRRVLARRVHRTLYLTVRALYGIVLPSGAVIGRRMQIGHQHGIVVNAKSEFGDDCSISHNFTTAIGAPGTAAVPRFGDRVTIGPNVVVIGKVTVGDDVEIGAGAVVFTDVPSGARVEKRPTRVLQLLR
jgi:serine O-acetyltransferase